MRHHKKRRYNPLPKLETPKDEIEKVIQIISERAKVGADESVLTKEDDPEGFYTPFNLVLFSVKPKMQEKMLRLLRDPQEPFYRGVVEELEGKTSNIYQEGTIPPEWLTERESRRGKTNILRDEYTLWGDYSGSKPASFDEFRDRLNFGATGKRRRMRRRRR